MKSILAYGPERELDYTSLHTYLQLNYIPAPRTIFKNVKKLLPGHYIKVHSRQSIVDSYYGIPHTNAIDHRPSTIDYDQAKNKFKDLLEAPVQRSLISIVPFGTFLSDGINTSV